MSSPARLVCPECRADLRPAATALTCTGCGTRYQVVDGVAVLTAGADGATEQQAVFFDESIDAEFEIERPAGAPRLYAWLLREKFGRVSRGVSLRGKTVLVVCGGSGMDAEFLARAGANVVSSDISLGAARRTLERGRRHGIAVEAVVANVERLPFADRSVDVVYVHDGLHHIERPLAGLAEMARVAREVVCVTEPAQALLTRLAVRLGWALDREDAGNQVARLDTDDVVGPLRSAGFEVVRAERYALFYRHVPGPAMRLLSLPGLFLPASVFLAAIGRSSGSFGNKLAVVARRAG